MSNIQYIGAPLGGILATTQDEAQDDDDSWANQGTISSNLFGVSAAAGSGKTYAFIKYLVEESNITSNYCYIAPTVKLAAQTATNIMEGFRKSRQSDRIKKIKFITSEHEAKGAVAQVAIPLYGGIGMEVIKQINSCEPDSGTILIFTTQTFLNIVDMLRGKKYWDIVLDETFNVISHRVLPLGETLEERSVATAVFDSLVLIDENDGNRMLPRNAKNLLNSSNDKAKVPFFYRAFNKNLARELLAPSVIVKFICKVETEKQGYIHMAAYIKPDCFKGFNSVINLSALLDETLLYLIWTKVFSCEFREHDYIQKIVNKNDTHVKQGKYITFYHALHADDTASQVSMRSSIKTGKPSKFKGSVAESILDTLAKNYGTAADPIPVCFNKYAGWMDWNTVTKKYPTLKFIEGSPHGLNTYSESTVIGALCFANYHGVFANWLCKEFPELGMRPKELSSKMRFNDLYQQAARIALRDMNNKKDLVVVTGSRADVDRGLGIYHGSRDGGQLGNIPSLRTLRKSVKVKDGKVDGRTTKARKPTSLQDKIDKLTKKISYEKSKGRPIEYLINLRSELV